ncbi:hypothetical protein SAMN05421866_1673 [Chryseobacterium oranimense]|uniref:Uncharacterized protein n=1 Tax=Chryseobacterium oranimense TaxID=421058 RepID=A0A1M5P4J6_9FLAO|nr:hypothetical protein [Chryseobacterium oranimense]CEJ68335.1 hypothetical protein BN1195_00617 [Chryseobacterium oranimense G311]SHG96672.1 hypothetical protein SAMN05421866_1673 [Chryseobacterium oranimense]
MKKITFIITILVGQSLFSQNTDILNVVTTPDGFYSKPGRVHKEDRKIDGSPYINGDKFEKVTIKDYSKNVQDLRYNAYQDEMEFKMGEELYNANKTEGLKIHFPALKKTYESLTYSYEGKTKTGYLVILVDNPKFSLYKREKMELMGGTKSNNGFTKDANDYYEKDKDLYLIAKDKKFFKFPKNSADAAAIFSVDKKDLDNFVKSNKINFNKESDMIKLVEFINK